MARRFLSEWCRRVDDSYVVAAHHRRLLDKLEAVERGECTRLLVSMPPRHGKSLTSTIRFPAWFLGRNPEARVILAAHTASLAADFSRRARNELAEHGRQVFGVELAEDSSAVDHWQLKGRRGGLVAAGVGGPITGRGADLFVIDDPVKDAQAAESETQRKAVVDWWQQVARTRLHPGGRVVVCMTRWHERDLAGWLLAEGGEGWECLTLPMVDDSGAVLWPERYSAQEVANLKSAVGTRAWEALYQQRPSPAEGAIFKREWFRRFGASETPKHFDEVLLSWDMAFKGTDGSDFVAGQVWGRLGAKKYLLERVHKRMDFPATLAAFQAQVARYPEAGAKLVEDAANGPAVVAMLRDKVPGLIAVRPVGGKEARAHAVTPTCEAGDVHLPAGVDGDELLSELCSFPNGAHDDEVDAMTQALNRMRSGGVRVMPAPARRERGEAVVM